MYSLLYYAYRQHKPFAITYWNSLSIYYLDPGLKPSPVRVRRLCPMHSVGLAGVCSGWNILPGISTSSNKTLSLSSCERSPGILILERTWKAAEILWRALKDGNMISSGQLKVYVGWGRPKKTTCEYCNGRTLLHCLQLLETWKVLPAGTDIHSCSFNTRHETTGTSDARPSLRFLHD